jgi:hypothetical protein
MQDDAPGLVRQRSDALQRDAALAEREARQMQSEAEELIQAAKEAEASLIAAERQAALRMESGNVHDSQHDDKLSK